MFPVPLLLSAGLATHAFSPLLAAFLVQYLGLPVERLFFRARANHQQERCYQTA